MSEFIPYTTEQILDLFKTAYYEQNGTQLLIGSNEFAFSSVAAYVLRVFEQSLQHGADNANLETATGAALDMIGATYGLSRWDLSQTARCGLSVTNTTDSDITVDVEDLFWENDETEFINVYPYVIPANGSISALMYATEGGAKYNGIVGIEPRAIEGLEYGTASMTYGGVDAPGDYTPENDAEFRSYIKQNLKGFAFGTPSYYETLALNNNYDICTSAYCLRDGDVNTRDDSRSFEEGKVKVYVAFKQLDRTMDQAPQSIGTADFRSAEVAAIQRVLSTERNKCLTDTVEVYEVWPLALQLQNVSVLYESRFQALNADGEMLAKVHYNTVLAKYRKLLLENCSKPFIENELQQMLCTPDENGVYASGWRAGTPNLYKACQPGEVITIVGSWATVTRVWI